MRIDTRPGHGTTITLYLPRAVGTVEREADVEAPSPHTGEPPTILVVDDDPDVQEVIVGALEELNYKIVEAHSGRAALDALKQGVQVDLALIDLVMPGLGGRQLASRIRANHPELAVLFMSGYDGLSGDGEHLGEELLLKKPFTLASLAAAIEGALAFHSRTRVLGNVTPMRPRRMKT